MGVRLLEDIVGARLKIDECEDVCLVPELTEETHVRHTQHNLKCGQLKVKMNLINSIYRKMGLITH